MVSKEMSAARKLGTKVRSHTPRVSGTTKKASRPRVWPGRRCSAKNRRRKVRERASTLATDGHHAQLDQQRDQNEPVGHPTTVSRRECGQPKRKPAEDQQFAIRTGWEASRAVTRGEGGARAQVEWKHGI